MADKHSRNRKKGVFCAVAARPCDCGNDYVKNCDPKWKQKDRYTFKLRSSGGQKTDKVFEAHHLLCVASVGSIIVGDSKITSVVRETKWCVNNKANMYAMPLFGNTVKWYCDGLSKKVKFKSDNKRPPFANIPQHDWDHTGDGGYIQELNPELRDVANEIKNQKKKHEVAKKDLLAKMKRLSKDFKSRLTKRGKRLKGTHKAWGLGKKGVKRWYDPFSMAQDGTMTGFAFPGFSDEVARKMETLVDHMTG